MSAHPALDDAKTLFDAAQGLLDRSLEHAREITSGGKTIDDHQVLTERVAYAATEARAASEAIAAVEQARADGVRNEVFELTAVAAVGDLVHSLRDKLSLAADESPPGPHAARPS